jgi:hypothetical protein
MKDFAKNILFFAIYFAIVITLLAILKELTCEPFYYEKGYEPTTTR